MQLLSTKCQTNMSLLEKIKKTKEFQRRNAEWPYENWDYTEWEELLLELEI